MRRMAMLVLLMAIGVESWSLSASHARHAVAGLNSHSTPLAPQQPQRLMGTHMTESDDTDSRPVRGFIGLGIMGVGMANCLLAQGYPLSVWTRNATVATTFQAAATAEGGPSVAIAASPREVIQACDVTFVMLSTPEACSSVYRMDNGLLAGVTPGKAVVDCATLRVEDMVDLESEVHARGGRFLEAPVSGSKVPAQKGQLIFMTAGDEELHGEIQEELGAMGKDALYCGPVGAATRMKLVVNLVMGAQLAALAEGIALAEALGLSTADMQCVLDQGAMASPMLKLKGPLMAKALYESNFPLKYAHKDMRFALQEAESSGQAAPTCERANALYKSAVEMGLGELDFAAVADAARDLRR